MLFTHVSDAAPSIQTNASPLAHFRFRKLHTHDAIAVPIWDRASPLHANHYSKTTGVA